MAELFDMIVRHQIYVEGLKQGRAEQFDETVAKIQRSLERSLAQVEFENLGDMTKTALASLVVTLRKKIRRIFDPWLNRLTQWLERFTGMETRLYAKIYGIESGEDRIRVQGENAEVRADDIFAASKTEPMQGSGQFMLPFLAGFATYAITRVERLLVAAYGNRETKSQFIDSFAGTRAMNFRNGLAIQLTRQQEAALSTVINHLSAQTNFAVGSKRFRQYEWVAILDSGTTDICRSRDGNRYTIDKKGRPIGPLPPAHIRCRSTIMFVRRDQKATPTSFLVWANRQPKAFLNDALAGKSTKRYEKSKPITLDEFSDKDNLILTD